MSKAPLSFWIDFILYPLLAIGLCYHYHNGWPFVAWFVAGFLFFTFLEYWIHRLALHEWWHSETHNRHHDHPEEYSTFPIWYTPSIFAAFFVVMYPFPIALFTGFVVGFVWFCYWHHILHHVNLKPWPRFVQKYAAWHMVHHGNDFFNYGITVPIWDFVFNTHKPARRQT